MTQRLVIGTPAGSRGCQHSGSSLLDPHSPHLKKNGAPKQRTYLSAPGARRGNAMFQTAAAVSSCRASRFRATCSRRLIVPIGAANDSLISLSDSPRT